jgi:SpoVK/Ycf46/Vps4 family AAA+-type ATPase
MQEKESSVFVIATANNISNLPPELLRKGRFDEIFFVDLPTQNERKEIFKLHLEKRLKDKEVAGEIAEIKNVCTELAKLSEGFIGSEIEQVVISALFDAFSENRALKFEDLANNIATTVPLSKTQKEQILALRAWANVRAVSATKTSSLKQYTKEINEENIASSRGGRNLDF